MISFTGADNGSGLSYMPTWHERHSGEREVVHLRYLDAFIRTQVGWRIASRRVEASGVLGFEGVEWHWVQRHPPEA